MLKAFQSGDPNAREEMMARMGGQGGGRGMGGRGGGQGGGRGMGGRGGGGQGGGRGMGGRGGRGMNGGRGMGEDDSESDSGRRGRAGGQNRRGRNNGDSDNNTTANSDEDDQSGGRQNGGRNRGRQNNSGRNGGGRGNRESGLSSASEITDQTKVATDTYFSVHDKNKNGTIDKDEISNKAGEWNADRNGDQRITKSELTAYNKTRYGAPPKTVGNRNRGLQQQRKALALDTLPEGLPDWFYRNDRNGDYQIMMTEFTTNWTNEKVSEFQRYDLNNDGAITVRECQQADQ
ncbi:MAG: hypothetical protein MPJ24_04555 [Pirellulaceae bacterium]|nr:hypothetical protein [Pirellulaceae bacterium]